MKLNHYVGISLAVLVVACAGEERARPGEAIVRDSAGIAIVEHPHGLDSAAIWSVADEPTVALGEEDGREEELFSQIVSAFTGSDGTLVVADAQSREIRWFQEDGGHLRTSGGRGDGPGEFQNLSWVGPLTGDTIGAWDGAARRLSFFSASGDFLASQQVGPIEGSFDSPPGTFIASQPQALGVFGDGSLLVDLIMVYPDVPAGVRRDSLPLLLFDRGTQDWERIGTTLAPEFFVDPDSEVLPALPLPFGIRTRVAVADDWAVIAWGDDGGFTVLDRTGDPGIVVRPNFERIPLSPAKIEADRRARVSAVPEAMQSEYRRALEAVPYPSAQPAHGRIVAVQDEFWVEELVGSGSPERSRWVAFSRSGGFLGAVAVPSGLRITDVRNEHLVGVVTDDFGVPRVLRFRLHRDDLESDDANVGQL